MYSLSHKILAEAKAILIKKKFDPDSTANNYLALGLTTESLFGGPEMMLLSDSSLSEDSEDSDISENDNQIEGVVELEDEENSSEDEKLEVDSELEYDEEKDEA